MKIAILLGVLTLTLAPFSGGLPQLPLGGGGGGGNPNVLGPNPYRQFPVKTVSQTQVYNATSNRFAVDNTYFSRGQDQYADAVGLNLRALGRVVGGLGRSGR